MTEHDRPAFENLLLALGATFRVDVTTSLRAGYWLGLRDLTIADVQEAATKAIAGSRHMPTPRDLRDLAGVMGAEQRAILAWNALKQAIREVGSYRSVTFDDPTINAVVRTLGGWPRVCLTDSEELDKWTSKEFQRLYRELSALQLHQDLTRHLPGVFETSGQLTEKVPPRRIAAGTGRALEAPPLLRLEAQK